MCVNGESVDLQQLRDNPPRIHGEGEIWGLSLEALGYLDRTVGEGMATLETGIGLSTAVFAMRGARHVCINPDEEQVEKFSAYCDEVGLDLSSVTFVLDFSETVLPTLEVEPLDVALIDGGHGFPTPWIDWFYISRKTKVGGIILIDDTQVWTGRVLRDFLRREPGWAHLGVDLGPRTSAFRMSSDAEPREWHEQPYVVARSRPSQIGYRARAGLRLLRDRRFGRIAEVLTRR